MALEKNLGDVTHFLNCFAFVVNIFQPFLNVFQNGINACRAGGDRSPLGDPQASPCHQQTLGIHMWWQKTTNI